ncbi:MAG: 7,8-didemethyl-8-hydroxy-5-deazariboflavin synthase subunit CofG [Deltaproteobacteria bacterium]|jgi:7,8-didemethyl-8-hydroxy-5-deazariboflavin synthase|nr:7,8-didemethyl-8-hydroxy-5-deazariboflavin synthase subunit CofG [Deltaproteobacteria bacterium]
MIKHVSYSPAVSLALTKNCNNRCLYCGFRDENDGLVSFDEIKSKTDRALQYKATEILLISGEKVDKIPNIKDQLRDLYLDSFTKFVEKICQYLLTRGLLPHINIGLLDQPDLATLKNCCASMGLMMEGDYGKVSANVQPQKVFRDRLRNLESAGQYKIPFTTGLLVGIGETREDRRRSISAIAQVHQKYGHVQEIIIQPYSPNFKSRLRKCSTVSLNEIRELADQVHEEMPAVHLQFPPNLFENWLDLLNIGFDDLGGIGFDEDLINPDNRWPSVQKIEKSISSRGFRLRKRLPLYPEYYAKGWYSNQVAKVIERIIKHEDEYRYYIE